MPLVNRPRTGKIPADIDDKLRAGREEMQKGANTRRLCTRFERGETYWYINGSGALYQQDTTHQAGGDQAPWRIRNKYNFIRPIIEGKISAATQRVPSYEVVPSTTEPEDAAAARLAEKVALFGYDKWGVRRTTIKAVRLALVQGEGFVMPVFDPNVGPFVEHMNDKGEIEQIGQGELRLLTFDGNQVYWQPGSDFYESPWWGIERAMTAHEAKSLPGYVGGDLKADATTSTVAAQAKPDRVLVTEYLERPCPKYPNGRRLFFANGRVIVPQENYPRQDAQGNVIDEPVIHRLSYSVEPTEDRDMGLVEQLVDLERTIQDCWNKLLEWKNRTLFPQMTAPKGSNVSRRSDQPGATWYYNVIGGQKPEWEKTPPVPRELFEMLSLAIDHMRALAADIDVQAEPDLAARTAQAAIEQGRQRWQSFIGDLAEWHGGLMRHCLSIVARRYTEPRLVKIAGLFGPDPIPGFLGADLNSQVDIRVSPASLELKSRKQVVEEAVMFFDRQLISGEAFMATIKGGTAETLGMAYELDVARAHQTIQKIKEGPDVLFSIPMRLETRQVPVTDPMTGVVSMVEQTIEVPGWLPRKDIDNTGVWIQTFSMWMKTSDYDRLHPGMQEAAMQVFKALVMHRDEERQQAAIQQDQMAQGLGQANAAKPQQAAPTPDQRMPNLPES